MTTQDSTTNQPHKSNICQTRFLKVREASHSYQQDQSSNQRIEIGQVELKGHWLIEAGFKINTPIKVQIMQGCLVVTIEPDPSLSGFNQLKQNEQRIMQDILGEFLKLKSN